MALMERDGRAQAGVRVEVSGHVAVLTIDRPEARNAIGRPTMAALQDAIDELAASDARVVVVTGGGDRVFVSGGDLKDLAAVRTHEAAVAMAMTMRGILDGVAALPVPVIAAVNGSAFGGGGEVAVACDIRIAADDVQCAFNQVALGIMPAWGGIERLTGLIGRGRALALMASGRIVTAEEALALGLFDEIAPRAQFPSRWRELAAQIAKAPRDALVGIKAAQRAAYPTTRPDLAGAAVDSFARSWIADTHWQMVEDDAQRRRAARG